MITEKCRYGYHIGCDGRMHETEDPHKDKSCLCGCHERCE